MSLTEAQRHAVETTSREVLCLAGAGAGKTTVMTERVIRQISGGMSPHDFLILTFTRRAAGQMRDRIVRRLEEIGRDDASRAVRSMLLGTIHSVALRWLRLDGDTIGLNGQTLTVLDQQDADALLDRVCADLGYRSGKSWKHDLSWTKVNKYREAVYTGRAVDYEKSPHRMPLQRAMAEYRHRLIGVNALDYGSILCEALRLLTEYPNVLARYRERIHAVVVDEIQDLNAVEHSLIRLLCPPATFFGIGDPRQSLYGWRGAQPSMMFEEIGA